MSDPMNGGPPWIAPGNGVLYQGEVWAVDMAHDSVVRVFRPVEPFIKEEWHRALAERAWSPPMWPNGYICVCAKPDELTQWPTNGWRKAYADGLYVDPSDFARAVAAGDAIKPDYSSRIGALEKRQQELWTRNLQGYEFLKLVAKLSRETPDDEENARLLAEACGLAPSATPPRCRSRPGRRRRRCASHYATSATRTICAPPTYGTRSQPSARDTPGTSSSITSHQPRSRPRMSNKPKSRGSLSMSRRTFVRLQEYCRANNVPVAAVVEKLIKDAIAPPSPTHVELATPPTARGAS